MNEQYKGFAEQCWDYDHNGMSTFDPIKFAHLVALHHMSTFDPIKFAHLVALQEREACAKLVEEFVETKKGWHTGDLLAAIRAIGEVK